LVAELTKARDQGRPWMVYRNPDGSRCTLYEPGWPGSLDESELERLQQALMNDPQLAYWWGFRPGLKRRSAAAIERVAMHGDSDSRSTNVRLARSRKAQAAS
jgi:hypothetical protein